MMYGNNFHLEKKVNDEWIEFRDNIDFTLEGYILPPQSEVWKKYTVHIYDKDLELGEYRIATDFHRETLNGKDFGSGNYPNYNIYAYFKVGSVKIKRNMTSLKENVYTYYNDDYNFLIDFPEHWENIELLREEQYKDSPLHELLNKVDKGYYNIRLSHPSRYYQDVVLTVVRKDLWNKNVSDVVDGDFDLLPEVVFSNWDYIFIYDPYNYDITKDGYDEVYKVIFKHIERY
jgi:hypothetical protein